MSNQPSAGDNVSLCAWFILNYKIGCEKQVNIRRRAFYFKDLLFTAEPTSIQLISGGSRSEGLEFHWSDFDDMIVMRNISVFPFEHFRHLRSQEAKLLMESENVRPGFVVLTATNPRLIHTWITESIVQIHGRFYISSSKFRENHVNRSRTIFQSSHPHGPCATLKIGRLEVDALLCLSSPSWPNKAEEWIHRERPNNWPTRDVITKIINDGIILVPIGAKDSATHELEWRISFSTAEKILIHSFNHTQFLCYGLLKLFLKYVIDTKEYVKGLLCSYFMKTCIFYTIEQDSLLWEPNNLVVCFWACLKRLMLWVSQNHCPNYFIQNNNMFYGKISVPKQHVLLAHLASLYNEGYTCLLKIPACRNLFSVSMQNPHWPLIFALTQHRENQYEIDTEYFRVVRFFPILAALLAVSQWGLERLLTNIRVAKLNLPLSALDIDMLDYAEAIAYQTMAKHILNVINQPQRNKRRYRLSKICRESFQMGTVSDICSGWLLLATYYYANHQYSTALKILTSIISKFSPFTIYPCNDHANFSTELYNDITYSGRMSLSEKRTTFCANDVIYSHLNFFCLAETSLDVQAVEPFPLFISPLVYLHFLSFLCHSKAGNIEMRDQSLSSLQAAIIDDYFVYDHTRPISYNLLGICLQMAGSYSEAFEAYKTSWSIKPENNAALIHLLLLLHALINT